MNAATLPSMVCAATLGAGNDVVKRQVFGRTAILAQEAVTQEQVESGKSRVGRRPHILLERDDRGQLQPRGGTSHLPLIVRNDIHAIKEHRRLFSVDEV